MRDRNGNWEKINFFATNQVSPNDMKELLEGNKPLGFKDRAQFQEFLFDLARIVAKKIKTNNFKIVLSGSACTFYSENQEKREKAGRLHFFDADAAKPGDIDAAIWVGDREVLGKRIEDLIGGSFNAKIVIGKITKIFERVTKVIEKVANDFVEKITDL